MNRFASFVWVLILLRICAVNADAQQVQIRGFGAVAVALPISEAGEVLRSEQSIQLILRAGPSDTALEMLSEGNVDFALCNKELTPVDRATYPQISFSEVPIGVQFITMAVSRDVWEKGVHSLNVNQLRGIYEGRITNWKEVGGPDQKINAFMSVQGRGVWEMFVQWLYGEIKKAPVWRGPSVKDAQETRNMLEFTPGSFALVPPAVANKRSIFALAAQGESGDPVEPTLANVLTKEYPLYRPLVMVTNNRPVGPVKVLVDFMVGERGQAMVKHFSYVTLDELKTAKAAQK